MKIITEIITKEILRRDVRFVFPSETAASLWAQKTCELNIARSVARNRFIAWDRFKEEAVRTGVQNRAPVSAVIRKLFVEELIRRNADAVEKGGENAPADALPFLSIIPAEYARGGAVFGASIAALLPSLALWETLAEQSACRSGGEDKREDRDYKVLKKEYTRFLDKHNLFEPSWEKPPLKNKGYEYYIFFPEAIEDYREYETILEQEASIHIVPIEIETAPQGLELYDTIRSELRSAVLSMRRVHEEEGIAYEEMALSIPELETMEPYLLRELELYSVPFRRRTGSPLGSRGAGQLFSLIGGCEDINFSFSGLKSLLLNEHIPWRDTQKNKKLILFGIENNCVSSYYEENRLMDIWDEAFKMSGREEPLHNYYKALKKSLIAMTKAKTFSELRKHYFIFRGAAGEGFLSMEKCSEENDRVLARCVEELSALVQLEEEFQDCLPAKPFRFFLSLLGETQYVPQQKSSGVNIFPYRVAAASPFTCHFILNASQSAATVLYRPLKFLRQDKRDRLKIADHDASRDFFRLYRQDTGDRPAIIRISASSQTLQGSVIPHSYFAGHVDTVTAPAADPFLEEKAWWADVTNTVPSTKNKSPFPERIFSIQKKGFEQWSSLASASGTEGFNMLNAPFPARSQTAELMKKKILEDQWGIPMEGGENCLRVSATDLNKYFYCPLAWTFEKIFGIRQFSLEAELLDERSLGNLYHEILRELFTRIKEKDGTFNPDHTALYRTWIRECVHEAALHYEAFRGPLAAPLITAQEKAMSKRLIRLLDTETQYLSGYGVSELEEKMELLVKLKNGTALLNGKMDRISVSPNGEPVIIDYKTGGFPTKPKCTINEEKGLEEFQMPLYIRLYEGTRKNAMVKGAFYISVNKNELGAIVGKPGGKKGHTREEYQSTIDALDDYIEEFARDLDSLRFTPEDIQLGHCHECSYRNICRSSYNLNTRKGVRA
jgi:RecB family exonuclease